MPPDPTRTPPVDPPPPPVQPDRPAQELKQGAFDDSVAGEEDPGAGIDTLTHRPGR